MSSWHSYPSVYVIGHRAVEHLFDDEVIVQEKIDGSQFSFGVFEGELRARSKGKQLVIDSPEKMFIPAIETIKKLKDKLVDGWTYRGEYLSNPNHNTLKYNRIPKDHIIIFDINKDEESYLEPDQIAHECYLLGLEVVDTFYIGKINSYEEMKSLLEKESKLGGTKIEGIVFKNYHRFGQDKKVLMGKYVSEKFKEIHEKSWKEKNPTGKDIVGRIIDELKTEARWLKSVHHLKENDSLDNSPKDIGSLMNEVKEDIKKECVDFIKDRLYKSHIDHILRGCISGLPEWYKEYLAKKQFKQE